MNKNSRVEIAQQTIDIMAAGHYINKQQQTVDISADLKKSVDNTIRRKILRGNNLPAWTYHSITKSVLSK
ncbi:hypothetical protein SAMN05518672_113110 [Chitinophaga sp. CF118]|uniref:hypothetical protein n=1 Tax=Chitinophaga sp. CF118 TaxID=1884367 RepID=UPI0008E30DCC|nr:hypothetical protein [Chitinophaga sp. CF118]SFE97573.1 hypothetical protein SAMN05518672_113110 [Chitinophaga sp. CF118]